MDDHAAFLAELDAKDWVMWARTRDDVAHLNALARARMADAGKLAGPALELGGRDYQVGDEIVCLRNRPRLGVRNGTRGVVTAVNPDAGTLRFRTRAGEDLSLTRDYLSRDWIDHGYALTIHKSQGKTTERGFLLGTDAIDGETALVGMSRGKQANQLYVCGGIEPAPESHGDPESRDAIAATIAAWERSGAKSLALDDQAEAQQVIDAARGRTPRQLRAARALLAVELAVPDDQSRELALAKQHLADRLSGLERADERCAGARALAESARSAPPSLRGRKSRRAMALAADQRVAQTSQQRAGWAEAVASAQARVTVLEAEAARRAGWIEGHADDLARIHVLDRAMALQRTWRQSALEADPPAYVVDLLGDRPTGLIERTRWGQAVSAIEDYRERYSVEGRTEIDAPAFERALGQRPGSDSWLARDAWDRMAGLVDTARRDIGLDVAQRQELGLERAGPDLGLSL